MTERIYLSPPDVGPIEREMLLAAFDSNWIAPNGPDVDAFEREIAEYVGVGHAVATNSGTAALHLALREVGVGPGDEVLVPTLTFVATANAVGYCGAAPYFIDASPRTWGMDPELLAEELTSRQASGTLPAAVVVADLYGYCAEYEVIEPMLRDLGIPLVVDAAESLGSTRGGRRAGSFGDLAIVSFNGNKILTTSGGGMVLTGSAPQAHHLRTVATQARLPVPWYEHAEEGFNYRLSNLLAALGRGQLKTLDDRITGRRETVDRYQQRLVDLGCTVGPTAHDLTEWNAWLLVATGIDRSLDPEAVVRRANLDAVEVRRAWKPLHRQPLFAQAGRRLNGVADRHFDESVCLPTGRTLTTAQVDRVCSFLRGPDDRAR